MKEYFKKVFIEKGKIGQISMIFTWIFVLILAASILIFGFKIINKTKGFGEKVAIENEIKKIEEWVERVYYLDKDSSKEIQLNFPSSVENVCFVHDKIKGLPPVITVHLPQEVIQSLINDLDYNFFVLGDENRYLRLEHISGDSDNVCKNGRIKIVLRNMGKYVKVE